MPILKDRDSYRNKQGDRFPNTSFILYEIWGTCFMNISAVRTTVVFSLLLFVTLPTLYGQETEEEPPITKKYPIIKDTPPYKAQLNNFPASKFKSFVGGYGVMLWSFNAEAPKNKNDSTKTVVISHGVSLGLKAIDNFYNSKMPIELGMYYVGNVLTTFSSSSINNKSDKGEFTLKSEFFKENEAVKQIVANFTIGPHISIPNDYITTQLGIGVSAGFLFHHLFYETNKFYLTTGVGASVDLEFLFRFGRFLGVSLGVQFAYYPALFDSLFQSIVYKSTTLILSSIQMGMIVLSY